jgi:hypothetical protein
VTNELADHIASTNALIGSFVHLRQKAFRMMFDGAGHVVKPLALWTELTRISGLWDSAWTAVKDVDVQLMHARSLPVADHKSVIALTVHRDELRTWMSRCEADFEAELARLSERLL